MKYEVINGTRIPKIGFGTWRVGGGSHADPSQDKRSLAGLQSALELGYTHFDTAEVYANGHAEELLGQAIRATGISRDELFITSKVDPSNLRHNDVLDACQKSLQRLGMDYLDLYLIHWPSRSIHLKDTFRALNRLIRENKIRHVGVSNFNVQLLEQARAESQFPILTNQVPYSLTDRSYVRNGVLSYCQNSNILLTAYTPVEKGRMRENPVMRAIANQHSATIYQIALAWLASQPRVITIPMSLDPEHQAENLAAAEIELTEAEIEQLNGLA